MEGKGCKSVGCGGCGGCVAVDDSLRGRAEFGKKKRHSGRDLGLFMAALTWEWTVAVVVSVVKPGYESILAGEFRLELPVGGGASTRSSAAAAAAAAAASASAVSAPISTGGSRCSRFDRFDSRFGRAQPSPAIPSRASNRPCPAKARERSGIDPARLLRSFIIIPRPHKTLRRLQHHPTKLHTGIWNIGCGHTRAAYLATR